MSSCAMSNQDSDEEVDLEALRLAALKSRKAKYGTRVNHNNLIPIVPVPLDIQKFDEVNIKKEKLSPSLEVNLKDLKVDNENKENEEDKTSDYSGTTVDDQDVLSVEDKEEEDSLERLMDQLEAEISGKVPLQSNKIISSAKKSVNDKIDKRKKQQKLKSEYDDEIELIQVKAVKEPGAIIEIRESASPENNLKNIDTKSESFFQRKSPLRRSKSNFKSRSKSPFYRDRRSKSPYWSESPCKSKSSYRRSRSPFWLSRRSRSSSRKSRSPFRRYRSPNRKRSSYSRFSRSRSKSFDRKRSPWFSPRRRSKSPFYREWSPTVRRRDFNSPLTRGQRSFSPRKNSKSPRRSRSPKRFSRNSPFRRSLTPLRRSKSPFKRNKSPPKHPQSPYPRRSKSPNNKMSSPGKRPFGRRSRTPISWSSSPKRLLKSPHRLSPEPRSKSPKKSDLLRKSPRRRSSRDGRSLSFSPSPCDRRNRSPLRVVERNKLVGNEKSEKSKVPSRNEKRRRSLSRENKNLHDRQTYRQRNTKRYSPLRNRKSAERPTKRSKSPKQNINSDKCKEDAVSKNRSASPPSVTSLDPVLEARKKKFETFGEVDPTVDKKISLKSVKETVENPDDDEDALTINLEGNLWEESEESGDEFESRFKSSEAGKKRAVLSNRTTLSFRNLREGDSTSRQILLNKPLIEESRRTKSKRRDRPERWRDKRIGRSDGKRAPPSNAKSERSSDQEKNRSKNGDKNDSQSSRMRLERRFDRKPIVWNSSKKDESPTEKNSKENERFVNNIIAKDEKTNSSEKLTKNENRIHEVDDFDKLISDFEKELESDICLTTSTINSVLPGERNESKRPKISVKQDLFEPQQHSKNTVIKPTGNRVVKISDSVTNESKKDFAVEKKDRFIDNLDELELEDNPHDGPEDYIEDDDFALDVTSQPKSNRAIEKDNQSDLRALLSRRRNQRITKVVTIQKNVPTRLLQSAFQGLGNKKPKKFDREITESSELIFDKGSVNPGIEKRRVLLLQRENSIATNSITVPEVKPDTTIYQRFSRVNERRKRKLRRQPDSIEDLISVDQEDVEDGGFEIEEEKQSRRFRLKRNVTLSSQLF